MNGGGWMLLLEQPNQEALLQEFKGLCGTVDRPLTLRDDQVRVCQLLIKALLKQTSFSFLKC